MEYVIFSLVAALLISIIIIVILASVLSGANKEVITEKENAKNAEKKFEVEKADLIETNARLEKVIESLKLEVGKLEADNAACADPSAVRARLRGLFP